MKERCFNIITLKIILKKYFPTILINQTNNKLVGRKQ